MKYIPAAIWGIKWAFISQVGKQALQIITTVILVKILPPEDFGIMSLAMVVIGFINLFENLGTSAAVIQRETISDKFLSSIFWFNIIFCSVLAIGTIFLAPLFSNFYDEPELIPILQILSISFVISAISNLHRALAEKENKFDLLAKLEVISALISSVIGILLALNGFGVYSLVAQSIILIFIRTILLFANIKWMPKFYFSFKEIKSILSFSSNLTGANIIGYIVMRSADKLIIGKFLGTESLGYYSIANRIVQYPLQSVIDTVKRVAFPLLSKLQNNDQEARDLYRNINFGVFLLVTPMFFGLVAVIDDFVNVFFSENWNILIYLIVILVPLNLLQASIRLSGIIFTSRDKTNLLFKINLITGLVYVTAFFIGVQWDIVGVCISYLVANSLMFYYALSKPLSVINLRVFDMFKSVSSILVSSIIMAVGVILTKLILESFMQSDQLRLALEISVGALLFIFLIWKTNFNKLKMIISEVIPSKS